MFPIPENRTSLRIIDSAHQLFFSHGFSKVTMEEIADSAGVTKKTIYNHFPNKETLLKQVVQATVENVVDTLDGVVSDTGLSLSQRLQKVLEFVHNQFSSQRRNLLQDLSAFPRDTELQLLPLIADKLIRIIRKLIDEGKAEGLVRQDVSRDILPYTYLSMVWGEVALVRSGIFDIHSGELLSSSIACTLEGVMTEKGKQVLQQSGEND